MHLIGRWEKVRGLGPHGWGLPYLLDAKWKQLLPYKREEWWRAPSGIWTPTIRGGAYSYGQNVTLTVGLLEIGASVSITAITLDSAYAAGSAGDAIGWRFTPPDNLTLTKVAFWINSFSGTAANVNDINLEVRPQDPTPLMRPDTGTLLASATVDPGGATGWNYFTGLSLALTAGVPYWIVIGDADGNTTDRALVGKQLSLGLPSNAFGTQLRASDTTNGYTTTPTVALFPPILVLVFSDGTVMGYPITARANPSSSALERGWHFSDGWPFNAKIYGAIPGSSGSASYSGVRLWIGSGGPTGTPYADGTNLVFEQGNNYQGVLFSRPFPAIQRAVPFRCTFAVGASLNLPHEYRIGAGADADVKKAMLGGGAWIWTRDVASAWVDTDTSQPAMNVLVDDVFPDAGALALSVSDGLR